LNESKVLIGATRVERDNFRADALASREDARQHGREGCQGRPVDFGEVDRAVH
jgi:hypothetical protein